MCLACLRNMKEGLGSRVERGRSRITKWSWLERQRGERSRKALVGYYKGFGFYSEWNSPCRIFTLVWVEASLLLSGSMGISTLQTIENMNLGVRKCLLQTKNIIQCSHSPSTLVFRDRKVLMLSGILAVQISFLLLPFDFSFLWSDSFYLFVFLTSVLSPLLFCFIDSSHHVKP